MIQINKMTSADGTRILKNWSKMFFFYFYWFIYFFWHPKVTILGQAVDTTALILVHSTLVWIILNRFEKMVLI